MEKLKDIKAVKCSKAMVVSGRKGNNTTTTTTTTATATIALCQETKHSFMLISKCQYKIVEQINEIVAIFVCLYFPFYVRVFSCFVLSSSGVGGVGKCMDNRGCNTFSTFY